MGRRRVKPVAARANRDGAGDFQAKVGGKFDFDTLAATHHFEIETTRAAMAPDALHGCRDRARQLVANFDIVRPEE